MPTVTRETIVNALFTLLQGVTFPPIGPGASTTWVTTSRRVKLFSDVDPQDQPAMYLAEHVEDDMWQSTGTPPKRFLQYWMVSYFRTDGDLIGGTIVNQLITAIEAALAPSVVDNLLTLNGQVYRCRIEGKMIKDPGDIDNQGLLVVPIKTYWP